MLPILYNQPFWILVCQLPDNRGNHDLCRRVVWDHHFPFSRWDHCPAVVLSFVFCRPVRSRAIGSKSTSSIGLLPDQPMLPLLPLDVTSACQYRLCHCCWCLGRSLLSTELSSPKRYIQYPEACLYNLSWEHMPWNLGLIPVSCQEDLPQIPVSVYQTIHCQVCTLLRFFWRGLPQGSRRYRN